MSKILLTGVAGFIGWKTTEKLLAEGREVIGVDNLNNYYDVRLKSYRLKQLQKFPNFSFYYLDIENLEHLRKIFKKYRPQAVINLAARAGVRFSLEDPFVYLRTNILGTLNLLELCKDFKIKKFLMASTSSLYAGQKMPFKETLPVNTPISPYAATKKGAEVMCYTYHFLYGLDISIVRYFTVYGPAGRPDMSIFRFIKWIDEGHPVLVNGDGEQNRAFTYIDDIARGTVAALKKVGFKIINLGQTRKHRLNYVIRLIEKNLGKKAKIKTGPFHKADLRASLADITEAQKILNWQPQVGIEEGIKKTVDWFRENESWLKKIRL